MGDDIHGRYQGHSHRELFNELNAGDPNQVRGLAAHWRSMQYTADDLSSSLRAELLALLNGWEGAAGQEYQHRLTAIVTYASNIAAECGGVASGLNLMASSLADAKSRAEDPAATDDMDKTVSGAAKGATIGAVVAGPPGALVAGTIGAFLGHDQDEEEKERARQRMVTLVTQVATEYEVTTSGQWPLSVDGPPDGLPKGISDPGATPIGTGGGSRPGTVNALGHGSSTATQHPTGPAASTGPVHGLDNVGGDTAPGGQSLDGTTSLAGAPSSSLAGAGALSAGGPNAAGSIAAGIGPHGVGGGTAMLGGAAALTAGGLAASLRGASNNSGAASPAGMGRAPSMASDAVVGRMDMDRSAAGTGQGRANAAAAPGGTGTGGDDSDERSTWLTEDDMDWGDSGSTAPAVLGGGPTDPSTVDPAQTVDSGEVERD